ncbi:ABC transporter permease [Niallia circulans]
MFEFNEKQLWRERAGQTAKEYSQYLKYILNGHVVIVLVFY